MAGAGWPSLFRCSHRASLMLGGIVARSPSWPGGPWSGRASAPPSPPRAPGSGRGHRQFAALGRLDAAVLAVGARRPTCGRRTGRLPPPRGSSSTRCRPGPRGRRSNVALTVCGSATSPWLDRCHVHLITRWRVATASWHPVAGVTDGARGAVTVRAARAACQRRGGQATALARRPGVSGGSFVLSACRHRWACGQFEAPPTRRPAPSSSRAGRRAPRGGERAGARWRPRAAIARPTRGGAAGLAALLAMSAWGPCWTGGGCRARRRWAWPSRWWRRVLIRGARAVDRRAAVDRHPSLTTRVVGGGAGPDAGLAARLRAHLPAVRGSWGGGVGLSLWRTARRPGLGVLPIDSKEHRGAVPGNAPGGRQPGAGDHRGLQAFLHTHVSGPVDACASPRPVRMGCGCSWWWAWWRSTPPWWAARAGASPRPRRGLSVRAVWRRAVACWLAPGVLFQCRARRACASCRPLIVLAVAATA
jgi:hypothetical protein